MRIVLVLVASILVAGYVEGSLEAQYGARGGVYGGGDQQSPAQRLKAGLFNDESGSKDDGGYNKDYNNKDKSVKTVTKTVTEREQGEVVEKTVTVTETVHDRQTVTVHGDAETVTVTKTKRGHVETVTKTVHDVDTVTKTKTKWRTFTVEVTKNGGKKTTITDTTTKFKKTTATIFQGTAGTLTTTQITLSTLTTTSTSYVNGGTVTISTASGSVPPVSTTSGGGQISTSSVPPDPSCRRFKEKNLKNLKNTAGNTEQPNVDKEDLCKKACCEDSTCAFYNYDRKNIKKCTLYNYSVTYDIGTNKDEKYNFKQTGSS